MTCDIEFPESKYSNKLELPFKNIEDDLIECLNSNDDIDSISEKYHVSKRYIRDTKYRILGKY